MIDNLVVNFEKSWWLTRALPEKRSSFRCLKLNLDTSLGETNHILDQEEPFTFLRLTCLTDFK